MTRQEQFQATLEAAYAELFQHDPEYAYSASRISAPALAAKMTSGLQSGSANKDGAGIRNACKALGIKHTYKAIQAFLRGE